MVRALYYLMRVQDPRDVIAILVGSLIAGAIGYVVADQVLDSQNITGGLWDLGKFLLSVVPVSFATLYIFT